MKCNYTVDLYVVVLNIQKVSLCRLCLDIYVWFQEGEHERIPQSDIILGDTQIEFILYNSKFEDLFIHCLVHVSILWKRVERLPAVGLN